MTGFRDRLAASARRSGSWLCVGIDPEPAAFPAGMRAQDAAEWCRAVVDAVAGVACAVKPNAAFFEALGDAGHEALHAAVRAARGRLPVILDGKRNDVGHTARKYAEAAFDVLGADAVTVTPYLGRDTVEPFASRRDRGVFLLARTSNPSARDLQDLPTDAAGTPLWLAVARKAAEWDREWGNLGLVAGATYPDDLRRLRQECGPGFPLLVPGVGAQGADAAATLAAGADPSGGFALVNVGRSILQAGRGEGWKDAVRSEAARWAAQLPTTPHS